MKKHQTKKFLCALIILLVTTVCASANQNINFDLLEKSLKKGVSSSKDIQLMLSNAWQNGYDYCRVSQAESSDSFVIEIAVKGLVAPLKVLDKSNDEQDMEALMQAKDILLSHCLSIIETLQNEKSQGLHFSFVLMDDAKVLENQYAAGAVVATITVFNNQPIKIDSIIKAWNESMNSQDLSDHPYNGSEDASVIKREPTYILNISSRRFHHPTCDSVAKTKETNRKEFFGQRDELISKGYTPCGNCKP